MYFFITNSNCIDFYISNFQLGIITVGNNFNKISSDMSLEMYLRMIFTMFYFFLLHWSICIIILLFSIGIANDYY